MASAKYRLRFRKVGDLRLVSHLDLKRCFERLLRRADLPVAQSQGFHPAARLVFASALPLGIEGLAEIAELELTEPLPPEDVFTRLSRHALPGLEVTEVRPIDPRRPARVVRATYRLPLPPERLGGLSARCEELLARPALPVQRPRPGSAPAAFPEPGPAAGVQEEIDAPPPAPRQAGRPGGKGSTGLKTVDLRPYLEALAVRDDGLEMTLRVTPAGTARADEVLALLGLDDLLDAGAVLQRTALDLEEDSPVPPSGDRGAAEAAPAPAAPRRPDRCGPPGPRDLTPSALAREGNP